MNVICILSIFLTFVYCDQERGHHGKNATSSDVHQLFNVMQVTETPAVKAARKAHENAYNYFKSAALVQAKSTTKSGTISTFNPLVQSYIEAKKNLPFPKALTSVIKTSKVPIVQEIKNHNKNILDYRNFTDAAAHKQKSAEHLKALRNVIALQLSSYKSDSQRKEVPRKIVTKKAPKVDKIKPRKHHDNFNNEMNKKLAIIAAATALMDILDA